MIDVIFRDDVRGPFRMPQKVGRMPAKTILETFPVGALQCNCVIIGDERLTKVPADLDQPKPCCYSEGWSVAGSDRCAQSLDSGPSSSPCR